MPPRTAYSPVSRTVPVRRKPLISSQATSASVATMLPGAAEKLSFAMRPRGITRCTTAFTVVDRMRGCASDERERVSRDSAVMRCAVTPVFGDTRS